MVRRVAMAVTLVVWNVSAGGGHGAPASPPPRADAAPLWMSDSPLDQGRRLLIVVDPATRRAAVYHVDTASGTLTLKSARDLSWDLAIEDFNAQEPRPAALRAMLQSGGAPAASAPPSPPAPR